MRLPKAPARTTPGFAFSMMERALQECLARRQFGHSEMKQVLAFFGSDPPECVYCGSLEVQRWDHVIPIAKGGETVLGNVVPACSTCDDYKRDHPFEECVKKRATKDIQGRIERIKSYMQNFHYTPRILEKRLDEYQLERLRTIRSSLQQIRKDFEALIEDYKTKAKHLSYVNR